MTDNFRSSLFLFPAALVVVAPVLAYVHPPANLGAHKSGYFFPPEPGHAPELPESGSTPNYSISSLSAYASGGPTGAFARGPIANTASGATGWYGPKAEG